MSVRLLRPSDLPELRRMRRALWPDCDDREADALLAAPATRSVVVVAEPGLLDGADGADREAEPGVDGGPAAGPAATGGLTRLIGFAEFGTRPYAEGCTTSPVAYLEGIWVDEGVRSRGVATSLVRAGEAWARARGLREMASDFAPDNAPSAALHAALGFEEADRAVCVRKDVPDGEDDAGRVRALVDGAGRRGAADPDTRRTLVRLPEPSSAAGADPVIRPATLGDWDAVWGIFHEVVARGDTYAYPPDTSRAEALTTWIDQARATYVVELGGRVVGTYYIKTNQPGQGAHVCNAGYMVSAAARGRGLGEALCRHSLVEARALGYAAMQYNLVVATNTGAVRLWERMGFEVVGRLPGAFRHPDQGPVDALVMYRSLD